MQSQEEMTWCHVQLRIVEEKRKTKSKEAHEEHHALPLEKLLGGRRLRYVFLLFWDVGVVFLGQGSRACWQVRCLLDHKRWWPTKLAQCKVPKLSDAAEYPTIAPAPFLARAAVERCSRRAAGWKLAKIQRHARTLAIPGTTAIPRTLAIPGTLANPATLAIPGTLAIQSHNPRDQERPVSQEWPVSQE